MKNRVAKCIKTCDHCNKEVTVLWKHRGGWLLCPADWHLYRIPTKPQQLQIDKYLGTMDKEQK